MSWLKRPLRELVTAHYGKALKKENRDENGDNQVFGSAGFVGNHNEYLVHSQTIIVGRKGSVGKVTWAPNGGWVIDTAYYLTLKDSEQLDWRYLYYALSVARLEKKTITTSIPGLNRDDFYGTEIPLPPLEEQKRIAAILDKADAIRHKRKRAIDLADEFLRSVFLDMFGDPVTNPKGWEWSYVGEYIEYIGDIGSNGSNAVVAKNLDMLDSEDFALMVRTVNLNANDFSNNAKYISKETYDFFKKSKIYGGEIIMNKIGSAGQFWVMPNLNRPVSLGLNQFVIRLKNINTNFLYHYLSTEFGQAKIAASLRGAVTKSITKTAVKELPIYTPTLALQEQFSDVAFAMQRTRTKLHFNDADSLFDSLSQKAFSGQL